MAAITLDKVVKMYGKVVGVDKISLKVADGEFISFLGPSGCGKTSTMRMIAGLEDISDGSIYIGDKRVNGLAPADRNVAMAFENYGLYPHMSLFRNIAYPLFVRKMPPAEIGREVVRIARLLHIEDLLDKKPSDVSGGVRQRVSLARALVRKPAVFLLDEPLSHLDAELRGSMRGELKRLHDLNGATTIYVTHDQLEAMTMSDQIAVMNQGQLQQVGTPTDIFFHPANRFVASFIGEPAMNLLKGRVESAADGVVVSLDNRPFVTLTGELGATVLEASRSEGGEIEVGVRPPDLEIQGGEGPGLRAKVRFREFLGETVLLTLDTGVDRIRVMVPRDTSVNEGDKVTLAPRQDRLHFFSVKTGLAVAHTTRVVAVRS
jgi:multiple sugar transport system ATP-binding protein